MKGIAALLLLAAAAGGCSGYPTHYSPYPDDSPGATTIGRGHWHFEGGTRPDDDCTIGRAAVLARRAELEEWYARQVRLRAAAESTSP